MSRYGQFWSATFVFCLAALPSPGWAEGQAAYRFDAAYTADALANVRGGIDTGARYLDNLDLTLDVDGARAFGWNGARFFLYGLYNNGTAFSADLVGDAQTVSNIETGVQAVRAYEAWWQQNFAGDRASLRIGLYDLNSEFDALETSALFINSAHGVGTDLGQTGKNGPSIFPVTSLAARADLKFGENWLVRAAVLDGVPGDPAHPGRTVIKLGHGDGALVVGEVNYQAQGIRVGFGLWRYTARFEDLETGAREHGNQGGYSFVEGQVYREVHDPAQGLSLFLRGGTAASRFNQFEQYVGAGAVYRGLVPGRPADEAGVAVAWAEAGSPYRRATVAAAREVTFEFSYRAQVVDLIVVQPDVQYVVNPGADPALKNALVLGLRLQLAWGFEG